MFEPSNFFNKMKYLVSDCVSHGLMVGSDVFYLLKRNFKNNFEENKYLLLTSVIK